MFGFLLAAGNLDGEDPIFLLCTSVWEVQIIFLFKAIFTLPAQSCGRSVRSTDVVLQEPLVLCIFPCPLLPPVCQCWNWCGSSCCSVLCGWLVAFPAVTPSAIQAGLLFTSLPPPPRVFCFHCLYERVLVAWQLCFVLLWLFLAWILPFHDKKKLVLVQLSFKVMGSLSSVFCGFQTCCFLSSTALSGLLSVR